MGALIAPLGAFDRMSVGFPGVVRDGVVRTVPNFAPGNRHLGIAEAERLGYRAFALARRVLTGDRA